jgi:hypothetical protein
MLFFIIVLLFNINWFIFWRQAYLNILLFKDKEDNLSMLIIVFVVFLSIRSLLIRVSKTPKKKINTFLYYFCFSINFYKYVG